MQEIHRGSNQNVELYIYNNAGTLVDADSTVLVDIYDMNSGSTLLTSGSAVNNSKLGLYNFNITPTYTSPADTVLRINWKYSVSSASYSQYDYFSVVTPYANISDIIDFNNYGGRPQDPNYKTPEQITYAEQIARMQINNYTGINFGRRYGSQEVFAIGSDAVQLTESMLSIDKVYGNGVLIIDNTVSPQYNIAGWDVELTPTGKAVRIINNGWDVRYDNQVDPTILYYGQFRKNERYSFTGYIGSNYVPQDIKLCTMLLVNDLLSNDAAWRVKYLKQIKLSETEFTLAPGAFNGTGNVIVDSILDTYRNVNIVVI